MPKEIVGRKLLEISEMTGISQAEVSRRTKLDKITINRIFNGKQAVRDNNLILILGALGVSPEEFYLPGEMPEPQEDTPDIQQVEPINSDVIKRIVNALQSEFGLSPQELELLGLFRQITPEARDAIVGKARTSARLHKAKHR